MGRPRLLIVPWLSGLEWRIRPQLESWAEVASFDAPGVGDEPLEGEPTREAVAQRGLEELDRRGWDRCTVIADEFGIGSAVVLASERPEAVERLALGHACLSHRLEGERAPLNASVYDAFIQIAHTDPRTFARHLTQVSQGGYDDEVAERWVERVPIELALRLYENVTTAKQPFGDLLAGLEIDLLFGEHEGCLMFTPEGFADAAAAFPDAAIVTDDVKPGSSGRFGLALRDFCTGGIVTAPRPTPAPEIPVSPSEPPVAPVVPEAAPASPPLLLVVEGDPAIGLKIENSLRLRFAEQGFEVRLVNSAMGAFSVITEVREQGGDLALLIADQDLGADRDLGISGTSLVATARDVHPQTNTVLLINHDEMGAAKQGLNEGTLDYFLVKPLRELEEQLLPLLDDLLGAWRGIAADRQQGIRLIGESASDATVELREFLYRNDIQYRYLDAEHSPEAAAMLEQVEDRAIPVVVFGDGSKLVRPTPYEIARALGIQTEPRRDSYDLAIIGGGPAGLAAAVYGASEGLKTILVERFAPGGQAGQSSRIENYLGFPGGLSGSELTQRALRQARRFEAEIIRPCEVVDLDLNGSRPRLNLKDATELVSTTVLIACGVDYRRLEVEGIDDLVGRGVHYGAGATEARELRDKRVAVVGGANSAGQAALHFAEHADHVTMLIRADSLEKGMSHYLSERVSADAKIEVRLGTEVTRAIGEERLEALELSGEQGGEIEVDALFIFIGAVPRTGWIPDRVRRDERGFILAGRDLIEAGDSAGWPLERDPYLLETSVPGVFVAGDARQGSVKRVASGVGEGAMAVQLIHTYLAKGSPDVKPAAQ